jgi:anion-transporting  ArsA/GET3 family ATPase
MTDAGRRHDVDLAALVGASATVICCGAGGVGKTTTAAALALEGARRGRRAVVVTIDPARRLADALGLGDALTNAPARIAGQWPGELWAMMLDTKATFDALVARYATDRTQADRILANRFYRNISGALSGTQEYMAAEKLYELHEEQHFDLVVVDTPPTRNALDFLDAPARLVRFLDHRLYRVLMAPTRVYMRAVNAAATAFLRTMSRVVGSDVIADAIAFFQAFDGMEAGFRQRADRVLRLMHSPETRYVLVAVPRRDSVDEAGFFADKLADDHITIAALIVNRMHPDFGGGDGGAARAAAQAAGHTALAKLWANVADFREVAQRESDEIAGLAARVAPAPVVRVPVLDSDVHDLEGLAEISAHLFGAVG